MARNRRAETPGFRRRAALAAAPARALGTNQNLAPLVLKGDPFQRRKPALAILLWSTLRSHSLTHPALTFCWSRDSAPSAIPPQCIAL